MPRLSQIELEFFKNNVPYSNLITNNSFEGDTAVDAGTPTGWSLYHSTGDPDYKGVTTDFSSAGFKSFRIAAGTNVDTGIKWTITGLTPGHIYSASAWVRTNASVENANVTLDANGTPVTTNVGANNNSRITVTNTVMSGGQLELYLGMGSFGGASDGEVFFDDVRLTRTDFQVSHHNLEVMRKLFYINYLGSGNFSDGVGTLERNFFRRLISRLGGTPTSPYTSDLLKQALALLSLPVSQFIDQNFLTFYLQYSGQ